MKRTFALLALAALLPLPLRAASPHSKAGTSTASFLKLDAGGRAAALGGAYTALATGAEALAWNPAGLGAGPKHSLSLAHAEHFAGSSLEFAAYGQTFGRGAAGVGAEHFRAAKFTQRDAVGQPQGEMTPHESAVHAGYAHSFGKLSAGVAGTYVRSNFSETYTAAAGAAGLLYRWAEDKVRAGLSVRHAGSGETDPLPTTARLGAAYRLDAVTLALEGIFPRDNDAGAAAGAEWNVTSNFALRAGYDSLAADAGGGAGVSAGLGFKVSALRIDYGFVAYGDLDDAHRMSVGFDF